MSRLKIIGMEEHCWSPEIRDAVLALPFDVHGAMYSDFQKDRLIDFGERRIQEVEASGVDQQVLSVTTPGTQVLHPKDAVRLARQANDLMAEQVTRDPVHFAAALATLPMPDPAAATDELERCITELGMRGALIHSHTGNKFIDHSDFFPILDKAAELGMPIYIHPERPAKQISDYYYMQGLPEMVGKIFSIAAWGWHMDAAINAIRLVVSGAFERAPKLQVILGHWGEMVPFYLERLDEMFSLPGAGKIEFAKTFREHFYVAPSGMWSYPMMQHALAIMGADRVLFAVDYPFISCPDGAARTFLERAPIDQNDKEKIGHRNVEKLLRLNG